MTAVAADRAGPALAAIVVAALSFNFLLCFANTNGVAITANLVQLSELALIGATFLIAVRGNRDLVAVLAVFLSYALFLSGLQGGVDPKPARDVLIPILFYAAARRAATPQMGDRVVWIALAIVLAAALFEFLFLKDYVGYFDIYRYYVARGTVQSGGLDVTDSHLFASGIRPEGRTFLPFLGDHRVSSIFLEPVSAGNFCAIAFGWIVTRHWGRPLAIAKRLLPVLAMLVLADARFGFAISLLSIVACMLAPHVGRLPLLLAPFALMAFLAILGTAYATTPWDNGFSGRVLLGGQLLAQGGIDEIFALARTTRFVSDSGYAYTLAKIGLIGFAALWALFVALPARDLAAWRFRLFAAFYMLPLLIISDSVFSIKTAALLWYLLGALDAPAVPRADAAQAPYRPSPRPLAAQGA